LGCGTGRTGSQPLEVMRAHVAKPELKANRNIGSGAFVTGCSPMWEGKAV
jgi:hypothetical protein